MDGGALVAILIMGVVVAVVVLIGVMAYRRERARIDAKLARLAQERPPQPPTPPGTTPQLGPLVHTYVTDDARRLRAALGMGAAGIAGIVVCGFLIYVLEVVADAGANAGSTGGVPLYAGLGISIGLLGTGVTLGVRYRTHRGETFALHEGGLVHTRAGVSTAMAWGDIESVDNRSQTNMLASVVGGDVNCIVRFGPGAGGAAEAGGGRCVINGHIEDAAHLAYAVHQAVYHGVTPRAVNPGG